MNIDYSLNGYAQYKKIRKAYVLLQNYCAVDHTVFVKIPVYKKIDQTLVDRRLSKKECKVH